MDVVFAGGDVPRHQPFRETVKRGVPTWDRRPPFIQCFSWPQKALVMVRATRLPPRLFSRGLDQKPFFSELA